MIHDLIVFKTPAEYSADQIRIRFICSPVYPLKRRRYHLFPVSLIFRKDYHDLLIAKLPGASDRNRICQSAVQIWNIVHIISLSLS